MPGQWVVLGRAGFIAKRGPVTDFQFNQSTSALLDERAVITARRPGTSRLVAYGSS